MLFEALENQKGNITNACIAADVSRVSFYRWLKDHEDLQEHLDSVHEFALDYVEDKLFSLIDDKNTAAILFYLKTKGQKRGYIEKQQIDHTSGGDKINPLPFDIKIESRKGTDSK